MSEQKFPPRYSIMDADIEDETIEPDCYRTDTLSAGDKALCTEYLSINEHQHILAENEKRIERLREALEFYSRVGGPADTHDRKGCWILARRFCFTEAIAHDIEKLPIGETGIEYYIAGKRARAALQEETK